jgi:hypothetical protein
VDNSEGTEDQFANGEAGAGILKPVPNDYLRRWPVSKRVNSSKADADEATLIEPRELAAVADLNRDLTALHLRYLRRKQEVF